MVTRKMWEEFRATGLLLIINQLLHVFGWAIVIEVEVEGDQATVAYPARVKFRGFDEKSTEAAYIKASSFMKENSSELLAEALDDHIKAEEKQ